MTPKEKAKELVYKYEYLVEYELKDMKQCALIAVDEILQMVDETMQGWLDADIMAHWEQVKQEICDL